MSFRMSQDINKLYDYRELLSEEDFLIEEKIEKDEEETTLKIHDIENEEQSFLCIRKNI